MTKKRKYVVGSKKAQDSDHCTSCGSDDLWGGFFDNDGLAVPDDSRPGWSWKTFCNQCGEAQP